MTEQTKYLRAYNCAILWEYYFFFWWPLVLTNQKMRINKKNYNSNLAAPMNKLFINFSIIEFGKRWITRTTTIVISQLLSRSQIDLTMTQHNIDQCTIKHHSWNNVSNWIVLTSMRLTRERGFKSCLPIWLRVCELGSGSETLDLGTR